MAAALAAALAGAASRTADAQSACAGAVVTAPLAGDRLAGEVRILGSAQIDRFNFYKIEWADAGEPESWIATSTIISAPVRHAVLDRWDTSGLAPGVYRLKLTVVDVDFQERCRFIVDPLRVLPAATATVPVGAVAAGMALPTAPPDPADPIHTAPAPPSATSAPPATALPAEPGADTPQPPTAEPSEAPAVPTDAPLPATDTPTDAPRSPADERTEVPPPPSDEARSAPDGGDTGDLVPSRQTPGGAPTAAGAATPSSEGAAAVVLASLARRGFAVGFAATAGLMLLGIALWARSARR